MANRPRWLSAATLTVILSILLLACTPAAVPTQSPGATGTPGATATSGATGTPAGTPGETGTPGPTDTPAVTPGPTGTPYPDALVQPPAPTADIAEYPNYGGDVDCEAGTFNGRPYGGLIKKITAPDPMTVVFEMCRPDVAFLSKIAFSVFGINDSQYLIDNITADCGGEADLCPITQVMNGTGALKMDAWTKGTEITFSANPDYWGEASTVESAVLRWLPESAQRLSELRSGTIDGFTLVGPDDFEAVRTDSTLQLKESGGLNTLYLGFNHDYEPWTDVNVRKAIALGIDRQRIVDTFLPPGSEVASHFTPCSIPHACDGDAWFASGDQASIDEAKALLATAGFPNGMDVVLNYRNVVRGYLPQPPVVAQDIQTQLAAIGVRVTLEEMPSGDFIGAANNGELKGLYLLGWGADYPHVTNFLDYHFGAGCTAAFGACYPAIHTPLTTGASTTDEAAATAAYTEANNAIQAEIPMVPISHAGFANAYLATVTEGAQVSPLSVELMFRMKSDRTSADGKSQIVFMQNAEPIGLYCADETDGESLRACEQSMESLYGFEVDGTATVPALAESCTSNEDLTVWTCDLREGVTFHNGATFEAADVITSFVSQWDNLSVLHHGDTNTFEYWTGLWGDFLNPPGPCGLANTPACPTE